MSVEPGRSGGEPSRFAVVILHEHAPAEVSVHTGRPAADARLEERLRELAPDLDEDLELDVWALREVWEDTEGNYAIVHEMTARPE